MQQVLEILGAITFLALFALPFLFGPDRRIKYKDHQDFVKNHSLRDPRLG